MSAVYLGYALCLGYVFLKLLFNENAAIDALFIEKYAFWGHRSQEIMLLSELVYELQEMKSKRLKMWFTYSPTTAT